MIEIVFNGISMKFQTSEGLFSPTRIDAGTRAMLACVSFSQFDKVLDLGCGYGIAGIYAAKLIGAHRVTMTDIDKTAVAISKENARLNNVSEISIIQSDGFKNINETGFSIILSNPPYHTDFSVAKDFIEKGFNRLLIGGKMVMVAKRRNWYKNKLIAIFGGVSIQEINGYYVFISEKRSYSYANKSSR